MKTRFWNALALAGALFFTAAIGHAQTQTNVTATILDPIGIPYANGTYSVQLIPSGTNPTVNGRSIGGAFNGRLDSTGSFNIALWPNASIVPAGTLWQFTICIPGGILPPLGTGGQCTPPTNVTISGTTQSLSATLSAVAPSLTTITIGTGTVKSVGGTLPIVATPNPITGVGTISCPTCGTGTIGGTATSGQTAVGNGVNIIGSDSQFLWDLTNHAQFIGPAESTLLPEIQGWFGAYPLGSEFVNSSRINGFGILQQGAGNALWVAAFATTNTSTAAITGQGVSDVSSGTINELIGFDGTVAPINAGTITNAYSFLSDSPGTTLGSTGVITNLNGFMASFGGYHGSGTVSNVYGFHSAKQGGSIHVTNSYGYYADDSGTGTNDWNYFSNGGKNKFLSGTLQVDPILTVASLPSTPTPYGAAVVIEGTGTGNVPVESETALLEVIQESGATDGIVLWNKAAPAGNSIDLSIANDGRAFLLHSTDGSEADYILFHADGSIEAVPATGKAFIAPLYSTTTNCTSKASPAVCAAAASGMVNVPAAASTIVVNTTAVTVNSNIMLSQDISANGGTRLTVTCNATPVLMAVSAVSAGVSFTITTASAAVANPDCIHYWIVD